MGRGRFFNSRKMGSSSAFTIVELLIVVVVIAILAAITIVSYNGITQRAKSSAAQTAAETAAKKVLSYMVTNADQVPTDLATVGITDGSTTFQYSSNTSVTPQTFCITATNGNVSYYIDNTMHNSPTAGGCPGHGQNGVAAVTNLVVNPKVGVNTNNWYIIGPAGSAGAVSRQTSGGPTGILTFYRYTTSAAATASPMSITPTPSGVNAIPVSPGQTYTASAYMRTSCSLGAGFRVDIWYFDSTGAGAGTYATSTPINITNTWQRVSYTVTPSGAQVFAQIVLSYSGPQSCPAISTFDATGVMLTRGSAPYNYADGDSSFWIWNGSPNASTSTGPAQ